MIVSFDGRVVYRNPFIGLRLMDEEIAIATLMLATANWTRGQGPPPYPLAQGCQDQLISLAIDVRMMICLQRRTSWSNGSERWMYDE